MEPELPSGIPGGRRQGCFPATRGEEVGVELTGEGGRMEEGARPGDGLEERGDGLGPKGTGKALRVAGSLLHWSGRPMAAPARM